MSETASTEEFPTGHPLGLAALAWVRRELAAEGAFEERVGKSQVAFRRRRAFACLWLSGFKQVVHPSALRWMHHLELGTAADLDHEVAG